MFTSPFQADATSETIDRLLTTLAREPRRLVVSYFEDSGTETASLDDLAEYVARGDPDSSSPEQVRVRLHHVDLPRLTDAGLVDYDARTETIRYRGPPAVVERDAWARLATMSEEAI